MTAKHKNPERSAQANPGAEEDEKLFDLERAFGDGPEGQMQEENANEKITELETALSELKEKHLRLLAEFDNFKKRTSKERIDLLSTASKNVIVTLLPVLDDFERAMKSMESSGQEESLEGVRFIYNRLLNELQSQGLKAMESTGQPFDPDLHEAIVETPVEDPALKGKIIETIEKGYLLSEKIIRYAKVVVGT